MLGIAGTALGGGAFHKYLTTGYVIHLVLAVTVWIYMAAMYLTILIVAVFTMKGDT